MSGLRTDIIDPDPPSWLDSHFPLAFAVYRDSRRVECYYNSARNPMDYIQKYDRSDLDWQLQIHT